MSKSLEELVKGSWSELTEKERSKADFNVYLSDWLRARFEEGFPDIAKAYSTASVESERRRDEFALKLQGNWKGAYRELSSLVEYCSKIGESSLLSEQLTGLEYVLRRGHARSCLIAKEMLLLLKNGYPDAAMSRWRAMYEVSTTMAFVIKHGEDCASRYIEHFEIDKLKAMEARNDCAEKLGYEPIQQKTIDEQTKICEKLKDKYGKEFKKDYGWARGFMKEHPSFKNIADDVGFGHWFIHYKTSSQAVHSSYMSLLSPNATDSMDERLLLAGQSQRGLFNPAQLLAITFTQLTCRVLKYCADFEYALDLIALNSLMETVVESLERELSGK
ncbi:hypothetical protein FJN13_17780 [Alteromonas mediterranea]|uniref:DUF5677 domain-containing protein n=1 Tax=Alteromonas mediterranea TaxID=314275 RepID=UPI001130E65A|nr:DUF5677 domain-containing protein [Alteromonas mediterranea]QDG36553.1 hypothetical protein FJN13_17780 [Alteromonas mediterranea]